jgi:glycosyltransferase involved in cell wall biosynthesis
LRAVHVLFIHQAFPAQFGRLALELTEHFGWRCTMLVEALSSCPIPTPRMLEALEFLPLPAVMQEGIPDPTPWPQVYGRFLGQCRNVYDVLKATPALRPDLIVAHGGRGAPTLFVPEVVDCPIINYCEYYFASSHSDISYRVDLPAGVEDVAPFYPRCINAPVLAALCGADAGYSATRWQKETFPPRFHSKIEVHFDGIDARLYRPGRASRPYDLAGRTIGRDTKLITFVARGLESMRGFDLFLRAAAEIARARSDVLFAIAGSDHVYYGWDLLRTGGKSFREWALERAEIDHDRLIWLGHVDPETLADLLSLADLHVYPTVPFVLSWSLLGAMAAGTVVVASDVGPVREVIEDGVSGLLCPLLDVDSLVRRSLEVLADPTKFRPTGEAARSRVEKSYSLEACIPPLRSFFERVASDRAGWSGGRV